MYEFPYYEILKDVITNNKGIYKTHEEHTISR